MQNFLSHTSISSGSLPEKPNPVSFSTRARKQPVGFGKRLQRLTSTLKHQRGQQKHTILVSGSERGWHSIDSKLPDSVAEAPLSNLRSRWHHLLCKRRSSSMMMCPQLRLPSKNSRKNSWPSALGTPDLKHPIHTGEGVVHFKLDGHAKTKRRVHKMLSSLSQCVGGTGFGCLLSKRARVAQETLCSSDTRCVCHISQQWMPAHEC